MGGLYWNPKIQACDWPNNVDCHLNDENEVFPESPAQSPKPTQKPQTQRPTQASKPPKKPTTQKPTTQKPTTSKPTTVKPTKPDRPAIDSNPFIPTGNNDYMVVW
jgi:hypothetical protein